MNKLIRYAGYFAGLALLIVMLFPHLFLHVGVTGAFALAIFSQVCAKNTSGASRILIAEKANVTAITITAGEISAITGSNSFMRIDTILDSLEWNQEESRVGLNNAKIANTINFDIMPPATATNTFLQALMDGSPCGFLAIIIDGNSKCWLVGHNATDLMLRPLRLDKQSGKTGKGIAVAEGNNIVISLGNECSGLALPFTSGLTASIVAGTEATFCKWS
jgi:hypothetical protein